MKTFTRLGFLVLTIFCLLVSFEGFYIHDKQSVLWFVLAIICMLHLFE
jgi:hypothetical protein